MFNPEIFAVNFARTVALLRERHPEKEQQKASLRAVFALTSLAAATVRLYDGVLSVDDTVMRDELPYAATLREQMAGHGIAEVVVSRGASATELLAVLRALAVDVGGYGEGQGVAQRLAAEGVAGIAVLAARAPEVESERRAPSVTQAFDLAELQAAEARAALEPASAAAPVEPPRPPAPEPSAPPAPPVAAPPPSVVLEEEPAALEPPVTASERLPETLAAPHGVPENTATGAALGAVTADPYGADILDRLSDLGSAVAADMKAGRLEIAVQAIAAVIGLEPGAPEGSPRASYGIVLRRMLTHGALKQIALMLPDPRFAPIATAVLRRGGADAADLLVELISSSDMPRDRKAFLGALRQIPDGTSHIVDMLSHSQWVVVKNMADLLGELGVDEAVGDLGKLLVHYEPRVRRSAAIALAKIGTVSTVEPLRRAMRDGTPEMRALVAKSIGGQHSRALAMPLVALAESETEENVLCEYYRALGRIGTAEAVEALAKAAQPGGRIFGRRPAGPRVAAVEGLRCAANPLARKALEALKEDAEKPVREAVARALSGEAPAAQG